MKGIMPCIWLDGQAEDAARLYTSAFPRSKIVRTVKYGEAAARASGQRTGSVMTVEMTLDGLSLLALNGGPHFRPNPAISFFVGCESVGEIDALWAKLNRTTRMELGKYPFAERYGWCEDQFGVNWQLIVGKRPQKIAPALLFANAKYGKAEEAINYYVSQFPGAKVEGVAKDDRTKAVLHATFRLAGQSFVILEGPLEHQFDFTPGVSFVLLCESQAEIDDLWRKLSAVPQAEQCGWLADRYGVSWQVVGADWGQMVAEASPETRERLMAAIMKMKKIDLSAIEKIYRG